MHDVAADAPDASARWNTDFLNIMIYTSLDHRAAEAHGTLVEAAALFNRNCVCLSLDKKALAQALEADGGISWRHLSQTHPHLFAGSVVFVDIAHSRCMEAVIRAVHRVAALPAWRETVLAAGRVPTIAHFMPQAQSVFSGYDFHLEASGPKLIEINTNAGGALLNAHLAQAQRVCCTIDDGKEILRPLETVWMAMFREEWRLERGDRPLRRIAIVDDQPQAQYLAPEFQLFKRLFKQQGVDAYIAEPGALTFDGESLQFQGQTIDLVYNRLTDFYLEEAHHAVLREAYLGGRVVLTPHPQAHALYANKRNLQYLGDRNWLSAAGASEEDIDLLTAVVPLTVEVMPENAERLWAERRSWFFKPNAGFGSRAAYRGAKLTRRVFEEIRRGGYVAQAVVSPSERHLKIDDDICPLKLDLRNYTYRDQVQLLSARLYRGQTTNMRTPGGGFASVAVVGASERDFSGKPK